MKNWFKYGVIPQKGEVQTFPKSAWERGYEYDKPYTDKETFFDAYLTGPYIHWDQFIRSNISMNEQVWSIGSGRAINELRLITDGYNVSCSDLTVPLCYKEVVKLFGPFPYIEFDALNNASPVVYDSAFCLSVIFLFDSNELSRFFSNINAGLKTGGIFVLDGAGPEDNIFSNCWEGFFLKGEKYALALRQSILTKSWHSVQKEKHGFKHKDAEIVSIAEGSGFELVKLQKFDVLTEFRRSSVIRWLTDRSTITTNCLSCMGRLNPYIRMFSFRKKSNSTCNV